MSGGSAARRPIAERVTAAETWQESHERKCEERLTAVNARLAALETTAGRTEGKVDLLVTAFIKEKAHPDGSTSVMWKLPKFSGKTIATMLGCLGGGVVALQLVITMAVPALRAGLDWVMAYGH